MVPETECKGQKHPQETTPRRQRHLWHRKYFSNLLIREKRQSKILRMMNSQRGLLRYGPEKYRYLPVRDEDQSMFSAIKMCLSVL